MPSNLAWLDEQWPPRNPYACRGSMYWDELAPFIRRNAALWHQVRFNFYPNIWPDRVTVMDWYLPELLIRTGVWSPQKGETQGNSILEAEAMSIAANLGWDNGECPMEDRPAILALDRHGKETARILRHKMRGVKDGIKLLLAGGVLAPTAEVALLLNDWQMLMRARR